MAEETTTTTETVEEPTTEKAEKGHEEAVPFERFQQANRKAKEAADAQKAAAKQVADLQAQLEERESAGLPELEQMKKRLEAAEKRAEENERKATDAEAKVARGAKERWVTAAAQAQNFADPSDAAAFLSLDEIEDEKDAERAVKRLAASKKHLLKSEEPHLPGRVLENGQQVKPSAAPPAGSTAEADRQWAEEVAPHLQKMISGWSSTGS